MSVERFVGLLEGRSAELHADNPGAMATGALIPTANLIDPGDVELFFRGVDARLITVLRGGKFNTWDRPMPSGHWSLLSRSKEGGWYNAEYLPQLAAYVEAVLDLGYPKERVLFELPPAGLQLDLAILDDGGRVVVLGEAKRGSAMLDRLRQAVLDRYGAQAPGPETRRRGDEARQLAWRLWTVRPALLWLIGPGDRRADRCSYDPLRLEPIAGMPPASQLGLDHRPARPLGVPDLASRT